MTINHIVMMTAEAKLQAIVELFNKENCVSVMELNCYSTLPVESRERLLNHMQAIVKRNAGFYQDLKTILEKP